MNKYYLPAEWQKQSAVQLTWPHHNSDWLINGSLSQIEDFFTILAENILNYQNLIISAYSEDVKTNIIKKLNKDYPYNYNIFINPSNDSWARDHGPITVINNHGKSKILDFEFNAWGDKYNYAKDNKLTENLFKQHAYGNIYYEKIDYILEGGAIDSNGNGTVLTTASCILNNNRNKRLSTGQKISNLKDYLNINKLIIIENSTLYGDDTDGHIDMLARFINPDTIVYTACDKPNNPNYENLAKLEAELFKLQSTELNNIKLVPLYIPEAIYNKNHELLPASYVNFLIINDAILVPTYKSKKYDQLALASFSKLAPNRAIIGINSEIAITQGGSLHCLTMQIPAAF